MRYPFRSGLAMAFVSTAFASLGTAQTTANLPAKLKPPAVQGMTAEELLRSGTDGYNTGDWAKAEADFNQFLREYGSNPQAAAAIPKVKPLLALSQVRLKHFPEALGTIGECLNKISDLPPNQKEELRFWLGICQMQGEDYERARVTFDQFAAEYPVSVRRNEALLMSGTILVVQRKFPEAADYFGKLQQTLRGLDRGRAVSLSLYCLNESGQLDRALGLITSESARLNDILQLAGFQLLALELGSKLLEKGEYRKAVGALQRVWKRDRVLKHQEERLQFLKERLAALEAQKADTQWTFQISQFITKIERELTTFRDIKNYDSGLQLRLASAFQGMERYREAALLMEAMLNEMAPDPIVEQASVNLMQCWAAIERWPKVAEAANAFVKRFPNSGELAMAYYLKGYAQQRDLLYAESAETFRQLLQSFPDSPLAARALFMTGFGELLQENYAEALKTFGEVTAQHAKDPMAESALYWSGMALSMAKEFQQSREVFQDYITKFKDGQYVSEAHFRRAYCGQSLKEYKLSISELKAFLRKYPGSAQTNEALILLGDAYMAEGEISRGIETLKRISPDAPGLFEEGWFKIGKALRLQEQIGGLRSHMLQFLKEHPESSRIAEALYWVAWSYRVQEQPEKAKELYWQAIEELGDKPQLRSVEDLFRGVSKLYTGEAERPQLREKLRRLQESARAKNQKALLVRAAWARARLEAKAEPDLARTRLLEAGMLADVSNTSSLLLADFADAAREAGKSTEAEILYRGLIKWNPRAPEKDRALAGLAWLALEKHDESSALALLNRFKKEITNSPLEGKVQLARSRILSALGDKQTALQALGDLLQSKFVAGKEKAEALFETGELLAELGRTGEAIPYYQRVYVMYGRWETIVAKAYLRSGEAFERIDDKESAQKTYQEMLAREDLSGLRERDKARERLAELEKETAPL